MRPNFVMRGHDGISGVIIFLVFSCILYLMIVSLAEISACAVMFLYLQGQTRSEKSFVRRRAVYHSLQSGL